MGTLLSKEIFPYGQLSIWYPEKNFFSTRGKFNPNRPLNCSAQTYFGINPTISRHDIAQARLALLIWLNEMVLFVIFLFAFQLQWNPIAPSNRKEICSKIQAVIIITLMTDLGLYILYGTNGNKKEKAK